MCIGLLQNNFQLWSFCILKNLKSFPNFIRIGSMQDYFLDRLDCNWNKEKKNILLILAGLRDLITRYYNDCYWYTKVFYVS